MWKSKRTFETNFSILKQINLNIFLAENVSIMLYRNLHLVCVQKYLRNGLIKTFLDKVYERNCCYKLKVKKEKKYLDVKSLKLCKFNILEWYLSKNTFEKYSMMKSVETDAIFLVSAFWKA